MELSRYQQQSGQYRNQNYDYNAFNMGNNNEAERPQRSNNNGVFNTNYYKFGLALLSIVSIICLININKDSQFMESQKRLLTNVQTIETENPQLMQIEDNSQQSQLNTAYYPNYKFNNRDSQQINQDLHVLLQHLE